MRTTGERRDAQNFFKHADRDHEESLEFSDTDNDAIIWISESIETTMGPVGSKPHTNRNKVKYGLAH